MKRFLSSTGVVVVILGILLGLTGTCYAAHPLITDDTGTQGKGKWQVEFDGQYGVDKQNGVTRTEYEGPTAPVVSYGLNDRMDIVLSMSYDIVRSEGMGVTTAVRGGTDASVELKARFYEDDDLSLAIKPGVILPTGNEEKGLGNGKTSYSMYFIATKEMELWAFHMNLGYVRNEYKLPADEAANRKDIWHASAASETKVSHKMKAVADIGIETNSDKTSNTDPAYILGGLVYSVRENTDVDVGFKYGLTKPETDHTILAGVTVRF